MDKLKTHDDLRTGIPYLLPLQLKTTEGDILELAFIEYPKGLKKDPEHYYRVIRNKAKERSNVAKYFKNKKS